MVERQPTQAEVKKAVADALQPLLEKVQKLEADRETVDRRFEALANLADPASSPVSEHVRARAQAKRAEKSRRRFKKALGEQVLAGRLNVEDARSVLLKVFNG
jgi:hypothetical protein